MSDSTVRLIFPHQLFTAHLEADSGTTMLLIEDDLFFRQYRFHTHKLVLHRASMHVFAKLLEKKGFTVQTIETNADQTSEDALLQALAHSTKVEYVDVVDDWLEKKLQAVSSRLGLHFERLESPGFLTSRQQIEAYFAKHPKRMQSFYMWQRRRLDVLMDGDEPVGGQWSFDAENRKRLPKDVAIPPSFSFNQPVEVGEAIEWVQAAFPNNPGDLSLFSYPVTHEAAVRQLDAFLTHRFAQFGPYEDAIAQNESWLFHSVLSAPLNCGLLTPEQVLKATLAHLKKHEVPFASAEGFIRQLIGWREYMRATYVQFGSEMRTKNHLQLNRALPREWWTGETGLDPVDTTIRRVLDTAYAHHIERLMVLGNAMLLLRIHPDHVYEWFMELFIDAYDWVMVPNVYAMSQFAASELITTKPYVSGSNYILKMSDYKKGEWSEVWDALYWQFVADYRELFARNPRSNMMVSLYDRMDSVKKERLSALAAEWLQTSPETRE